MKLPREIEDTCRKLKPIIGDKADKLWYMYLAEDEKGRRNFALNIEIIAEKLLKNSPLQDKTILLPPPTQEQANGEFEIGDVGYKDKRLYPLCLKQEDFIKQIGMYSITGGGKTNLALLLGLQLLEKKIPFMVIDWKRQWRSMLSLDDFPELKDIQVYTVGRDVVPFLWNPFRPPPGVDCKTWVSVIIECLEKSHLGGLGVGDFFIRIYEKLFKEVKDENFYPNFHDGMRELLKIKAGAREFLWWQSTKRIFRSFCFGKSSKSFNTRNPIKLEDLLKKPVIFELDQEMPEPLRTFFTEIMLRWIHLYRLSCGEQDKLVHCLFLEEIHNLFQKKRYDQNKADSLESVYREIRSFGQGLVSITQHPSLLPVYILGNCHTLIFLPLQHEADIQAARKALFLPREDEAYLNMLKTGQGIVKVMERFNPCHVAFHYVPIKKGLITDDVLKKRYGFSGISGLEKAKFNGFEHFSSRDKKDREKSLKSVKVLLADIFQYPFSSLVKRYERLGMNPRDGNAHKSILVSENLVVPKRIITRKTQIVLFELTQKGKAVLSDLGHKITNGRESITHKFWKNKIAEYYRNKNYKVLIEEQINGKPDIIVMHQGNKMAVEIETGNSDFIKNIERNLKAGFDGIVSVAVNKEAEGKIKQELQRKNLDKKVKLTSVFEFEV